MPNTFPLLARFARRCVACPGPKPRSRTVSSVETSSASTAARLGTWLNRRISHPTNSPPFPDGFRSCSPNVLDSDMATRSEEHTSELQSLMRISYAVFCLQTHKTSHAPLV